METFNNYNFFGGKQGRSIKSARRMVIRGFLNRLSPLQETQMFFKEGKIICFRVERSDVTPGTGVPIKQMVIIHGERTDQVRPEYFPKGTGESGLPRT